jgi:hypothetical protein
MREVKYHELKYNEFKKLVKETYNQNYKFVADVECGNDSDHSYNDIKKTVLDENDALDKYEIDEITDFKQNGKYNYLASTLLQDLVNRELLPEGNFLITVSW